MANLSNINNKFLVTTGGNVLIGQTAAVGTSKLQVTGNATFAGNVIIHNSSNAPYIDFVENADTGDSKARITMDQIDTNNGTLFFATENAGTLFNQVKITQTGNLLLSNDAASFNTSNAKLNVLPASSGVYQQWNYSPSNDNFSLKLKETVTVGNVRYVFEQINNTTTYPNTLVFNQGSIGIGTDDPDYTLHLLKSSGDTEMYINGQNGQSSLRMGLDARNWQIKTAAAPYLWSLNYVGTDVPLSNIITATVGGNVGIGQTNPQFGLSMAQGTGDRNRIGWNDGAGDKRASIICSSSTDALQFHTGTSDTEKMRIGSDGSVTIGSSTLTGPRSLTLLSATNATNYDINFQQAGTTNYGRIRFTEGASDFQFVPQVGQGPNLTLQYGGNSFFSRGNVGIGTTSPFGKLSVNVTAGAPASSGNMTNGLTVHNTNGGRAIQLGINESGGYTYLQSAYVNNAGVAQPMAFFTGATEKMRIDSSGLTTIKRTGITGVAKADMTLQIGYEGNNGQNNLIGFGYNAQTNIPAYIGYTTTSGSGSTKGDLVFGTRSVTTNTAPSERMRIDSSGIMHIMGATPSVNNSFQLQYNSTAGTAEIYSKSTGGNTSFEFYTSDGGVTSKKLTIANDGTSTLEGHLYLKSAANQGQLFFGTADNQYEIFGGGMWGYIGYNTGGYHRFFTSGTERMRITSGGNVDINANGGGAVGYGFRLAKQSGYSQIYMETNATQALFIQRFYNPNGNVGNIMVSGSATSYLTSSDYRLKENVVKMTGALDRVSQLKPSRFNFIADADKTVDGFLAHEVQEIVPEAITGEKDAMQDEEYEISPAVYENVVHPAEEAVYETIEHPAVEEELDDEGNVIVEGKEAYTEEVLVTEAKEEWTEKVLVSEKVMGTREVPDYQGIDQSKLVPLLVGAIQELKAEIELLKNK
jgi:hypothetical protein